LANFRGIAHTMVEKNQIEIALSASLQIDQKLVEFMRHGSASERGTL
jgi:hypothetical protein